MMWDFKKRAATNPVQLPSNSLLSDDETTKLPADWFSPCSIQSRKKEKKKQQSAAQRKGRYNQLRHLKH
jgi:hypothetical protein